MTALKKGTDDSVPNVHYRRTASASCQWTEPSVPFFSPPVQFPSIIVPMDWNEAAEQLLDQILMSTPLPVRQQIESQVRQRAEAEAESQGRARVNTTQLAEAWILSTPDALRPELPRQMERLGLDPDEFQHLLPQ